MFTYEKCIVVYRIFLGEMFVADPKTVRTQYSMHHAVPCVLCAELNSFCMYRIN